MAGVAAGRDAEGASARCRPVESVPAGRAAWRRPHPCRIRATGRGDGQELPGAGSLQLQCARYRQHGSVVEVRQRRAQAALAQTRSEEHTSELQSLMRITYAAICLKKKKYVLNTINDHA